MSDIEIRRMEEKDLDEVMAIERSSFKEPWSVESMRAELQNPHSLPLVAVKDGKVVGYIILWDLGESLHIANIAVAEEWRRKGIGTLLIRRAKEIGREKGKQLLSLEVRKSNIAARRLYQKEGFRPFKILRGYYRPDFEDAILYILDLEGAPLQKR